MPDNGDRAFLQLGDYMVFVFYCMYLLFSFREHHA